MTNSLCFFVLQAKLKANADLKAKYEKEHNDLKAKRTEYNTIKSSYNRLQTEMKDMRDKVREHERVKPKKYWEQGIIEYYRKPAAKKSKVGPSKQKVQEEEVAEAPKPAAARTGKRGAAKVAPDVEAEAEAEAEEEEEEEVEEAEVPAPEEPKDPSYQGTLKMAIIQITSKPKMVNSKDQYMDTHFATTVEELATKDNSAQ